LLLIDPTTYRFQNTPFFTNSGSWQRGSGDPNQSIRNYYPSSVTVADLNSGTSSRTSDQLPHLPIQQKYYAATPLPGRTLYHSIFDTNRAPRTSPENSFGYGTQSSGPYYNIGSKYEVKSQVVLKCLIYSDFIKVDPLGTVGIGQNYGAAGVSYGYTNPEVDFNDLPGLRDLAEQRSAVQAYQRSQGRPVTPWG